MKNLLAIIALSIATSLSAQTGITISPTFTDTTGFSWKGSKDQGSRHGRWTAKSKDGKLSISTTFDHGKLKGAWNVNSSEEFVKEDGAYLNNLRNGRWTTFYSRTDTSMVCYYLNGVPHGQYRDYKPGNVRVTWGEFKQGKKVGQWNTMVGQTRYQYEYFNDTLDGVTFVYNERGAIISAIRYDRGVEISRNNYTPTQGGFVNDTPEVITPTAQDSSKVSFDDMVLSYAEEMPHFPGPGDPNKAFQKYLADSIRYPKIEMDLKKEGIVYLEFVVRKDGSITDVKTIKAVPGAPGFSKEAERVIAAMPNWVPGKMNGKPVNVKLTVPVKFALPK